MTNTCLELIKVFFHRWGLPRCTPDGKQQHQLSNLVSLVYPPKKWKHLKGMSQTRPLGTTGIRAQLVVVWPFWHILASCPVACGFFSRPPHAKPGVKHW